jgi:uncharacterized protein (DUF302 family)
MLRPIPSREADYSHGGHGPQRKLPRPQKQAKYRSPHPLARLRSRSPLQGELGIVRGSRSEPMLRSPTQPSRPKMPAEGLIVVPSDFDPEQTMNRLEAEVRARGMTVFARIDHSAGARSVVRPLRPAEVLIFGNPRDSALLVQADQRIGIDLPLRVLVYLDSDGNAWIAYYSPSWLAQRHGLPAQMTPSVSALTTMLEAVAAKVARLPSR